MNIDLFNAYKAARVVHPWGVIRAADALRSVRYAERMKTCEVDAPRYVGDDVTVDLPRGESISIRLEHDTDADVEDRLQVSLSYIGRDAWRYDDIFSNAPDWWQDRDGTFYFTGDRRGERYTMTENSSINAEDYRGRMGRHDAYLCARAVREASAKCVREAMSDGYVGYVVTLRDADGDEVEEDSCWGFEATGDYAGNEARHVALHMMEERAKYWQQRVGEAQRDATVARMAFAGLAREYRELRDSVGANVCTAIRARLDSLRAEHHAAVRIIVGGDA